MPKLLIAILLAGAASPTLAAQDGGRDLGAASGAAGGSRMERSEAREQRREARQQLRAERPSTTADRPHVQLTEAQPDSTERRGQRAEGVSRWSRDSVQQPGETSRWTRDPDQRAGETGRWTRDRTGGWQRAGGDLRQSDRPIPNVMRSPNPLIVSDSPREGTQPALRADARRRTVDWTTNWRSDRRYDWRSWRDRHRSTFRVGIYYDPFGWNYRSYQIGWRLWPSYYGRRYWIADPWQYRLPYAPAGTVWVRYWDDALLVDTWSGEVVDVIHNFFW
jgi:Ni/Co efflux regulator RcnB